MKFKKGFCFTLIIAAVIGGVSGRICGNYILRSSLKGNISFFTFIFSPSQNFIDTFSLLNDGNDFKRLSGYYAYKESGLVDTDFLYERFKDEDSVIIKKIIIRIAEENIKDEKLVDFYRKLYEVSPVDIKKILKTKIKK